MTANLLPGFDATGRNSNGAPENDDAHGTACAGIIAAIANNSIGVAGVAYNAKIIPIRIGYSMDLIFNGVKIWVTNNNWTVNGINWAVQNGADILSNSWGGGSPCIAITNAINNAVNNGRGGKGCVVLFSTGNNNRGVNYPANLSNVIAVGATSPCDERKSPSSCDGEKWYRLAYRDYLGGSNFGSEIDVVAPGVKIYTTDISGSAGYIAEDYISEYSGTSAACPNAAGVAALVLSVYPKFTQAQVREIMEKTTDKIGGYNYGFNYSNYEGLSWNNEVGYGRLNAHKAVVYATNYDKYRSHNIIGPTQLTPGTRGSYRLRNSYISATRYEWNIPQDVVLTTVGPCSVVVPLLE